MPRLHEKKATAGKNIKQAVSQAMLRRKDDADGFALGGAQGDVNVRAGRLIVRRALALKREGIFSLLVLLTALLGWVMALGGGSVVMLQHVYASWSLERQQTVTIYLPSDSNKAEVNTLMASLATEPGIIQVNKLPDEQLRALLEPYGGLTEGLPVPVVVEILTTSDFERGVLDKRVRSTFPTAELDDARAMLSSVAKGVRLTQMVGLVVACVMVVVMLGVVVLTVRIGLRSQHEVLALLRQLGASDKNLVRMVMVQVGERVLLGWIVGVGLAVAGLGMALLWWDSLRTILTGAVAIDTVAVMVMAPLMLPVVAVIAAGMTAHRQLAKLI